MISLLTMPTQCNVGLSNAVQRLARFSTLIDGWGDDKIKAKTSAFSMEPCHAPFSISVVGMVIVVTNCVPGWRQAYQLFFPMIVDRAEVPEPKNDRGISDAICRTRNIQILWLMDQAYSQVLGATTFFGMGGHEFPKVPLQ